MMIDLNRELSKGDIFTILESLNYTSQVLKDTEDYNRITSLKCLLWNKWKEKDIEENK